MDAVIRWNPSEIAAPIGKYHHLAQAPAGNRLVFVSGQVGNLADGTLAGAGALEQTRQVFANLGQLLAHLGTSPSSIVKMLTFVAGVDHLPGFYQARDETFSTWYPDGAYPAHSLAVVLALAAPDLVLELEAVVAVPDTSVAATG